MRILFDQGVPAPLTQFLTCHEVSTAHNLGWGELNNGDLIAAADQHFDIMVTTDKNLVYQQNITGRSIAIFILPTTRWPSLKPYGDLIARTISEIDCSGFHNWKFPKQ